MFLTHLLSCGVHGATLNYHPFVMKKNTLIFLLLFVAGLTHGNIRLPKILSDHMVLQRDKPITVWGWADTNEKVVVRFKKQVKTVKTSKNGTWKIILEPEPAGGPYTLILEGKNKLTLNNVLIGEVWVCSGQSNMEFTVRDVNQAEKEMATANYPQIHQFAVQKAIALDPESDVKGGSWTTCNPETVSAFTAVGYFFARELYETLKIPIGIINTSWGGTHSETWTSRVAFEESPEFKDMIARMPEVDLESLAAFKKEKLLKNLENLHITLPASGEAERWKDLSFDDSQWPVMSLPSHWENRGLEGLDGKVWFRTTVQITAADAGREASLELGRINDSDESYVNGQRVGMTIKKADAERKYTIPAGLLKEGSNIIAVRVEDIGNLGGIYGEASQLKVVTFSNKIIPLAGDWKYQVESLSFDQPALGPNSYPTLLFNAMLNPLLPFTIRGVLWYQGESNAGRAYEYRSAFPLMIQDWRQHWKLGDFPFYFVQLASFKAAGGNSEKGSTWAELREAQTMTLSLPNTGMAVTTDIGDTDDIHPRNKQDVGKRLAAIAFNMVYGQNNVYSGPVYQSMKVEGNKVRLSFDHVGSGLMIKDKYGYLKGFEVAGSDQKFFYAKAWIEGDEVVVSTESVPHPVAVRFAWEDDPREANLFNQEGFPAQPFRTDHWKGITENARFTIH